MLCKNIEPLETRLIYGENFFYFFVTFVFFDFNKLKIKNLKFDFFGSKPQGYTLSFHFYVHFTPKSISLPK